MDYLEIRSVEINDEEMVMICNRNPVAKLPSPADLPVIDSTRLPHHIAVIMDGNGRWAKSRGLPRWAGHRQGAQTLKRILIACRDQGISMLTAYGFSTENWRRPAAEVEFLMSLFEQVLQDEIQSLADHKVQIQFLGDRHGLPQSLQRLIQQATQITQGFDPQIHLRIALNYGGRREILSACQRLAQEIAQGRLMPDQVTEAHLTQYLDTADDPDPDLLIRTSGEMRISNFLLWQLAYTEMYFTPTLWPDFTEQDLIQALGWYQRRSRRFGATR